MFTAYGRVLRRPGAAAFSAAGLVARLPLSMAGLGLVLLVTAHDGSYGQAGAVSAAYVLAGAVTAPLLGTASDRHGQSAVLRGAAVVYAVGVTATLVAVRSDAPAPVPHLCAALAGAAAVPAGAMVRARWSRLMDGDADLTTAFAVEAMLDEVVFIVGPVAATVLATRVSASAGLVTAGVAAVVGSLALAAQHRTEPPRREHHDGPRPPLGATVVVPLSLACIGLGALFGSSEVVVVAFATEHHARGASGVVLAVWSLGSFTSGLLVGSVGLPGPLRSQLRWGLTFLTLLFVPALLVASVAWLAVAMLLAGSMISPSLIAAVRLVETSVPASRLTEAISWTSTGLAVGVAPGAAVAGLVIDHKGASTAFCVPLVAGAASAAVAWVSRLPIGESDDARRHSRTLT